MLELLPLLADLELSFVAGGGSGNLSCITLAVGGDWRVTSSSDLNDEREEDWEEDLELGPLAVGSSNPF